MEEYRKYIFEKDKISVYKCNNAEDTEKAIETIFRENEKILPENKNAKILVKPNLNNDLNAITGNSTDLRVIIPVLISLKKRGYKNIILGDGPNCGVNHVGIDVFSRLRLNRVAEILKVNLLNFNFDYGKKVMLTTGEAKIAKTALEAEFIINLPKLKTHVEAGITCACKNYMGCLKGTEKRRMHDNLHENIVRLNEIIKTGLIIVDGLIGMEGRGPGDGIPKKLGVIISSHNPFINDLACSKIMGLDYRKIPFIKAAEKKGYIISEDLKYLEKVETITKFKPGTKSLFDIILLNNFFIGIRFSKIFEKMFNEGPIPWILFKIGVKQDKYVFENCAVSELSIKKGLNKQQLAEAENILRTYCPLKMKKIDNKKCLKCMYCYQVNSDLFEVKGRLNAFQMQIDRFGKFIKKWGK